MSAQKICEICEICGESLLRIHLRSSAQSADKVLRMLHLLPSLAPDHRLPLAVGLDAHLDGDHGGRSQLDVAIQVSAPAAADHVDEVALHVAPLAPDQLRLG